MERPAHLLIMDANTTLSGWRGSDDRGVCRLGAVLERAEIEGVTPHSFRRTVATFLDGASDPDLAAEMLGHTSSKITKEHYIQPDEHVNPITANLLEALSPKKLDGDDLDEAV